MEGQLVNVSKEKSQMHQYIGDVSQCKYKVSSIQNEAWMYKTNVKANILVIAATIFMVACSIMRFHPILLAAGIVLGLITIAVFFRKNPLQTAQSVSTGKIYGVFICMLIVCSIVCIMFSDTIISLFRLPKNSIVPVLIPVVLAALLWVILVIKNVNLKKRIWKLL